MHLPLRRKATFAVVASALALGATATAGPASAVPASHTQSPNGWTPLRAGGCEPPQADNYLCPAMFTVPNGTAVYMQCWENGAWADGNYWTNRWYLVWYANNVLWVHASLIPDPQHVGAC